MWPDANTGWWPLLWFLAKVLILLFCFVWLRGTLPRIRYDQLMTFGWKVLIPVSLAWILMVATVRVWRPARRQHPGLHHRRARSSRVLLLLAWRGTWPPSGAPQAAAEAAEPAPRPGAEPADAGAGFPVPPLDLPHYHGVGVVGPHRRLAPR